MSKADEMFKKMEYKKKYENDRKIEYSYAKEIMGDWFEISIIFAKKSKLILLEGQRGFCMQELQAINEKCKELGWNE